MAVGDTVLADDGAIGYTRVPGITPGYDEWITAQQAEDYRYFDGGCRGFVVVPYTLRERRGVVTAGGEVGTTLEPWTLVLFEGLSQPLWVDPRELFFFDGK